jgi:hypothetical protein
VPRRGLARRFHQVGQPHLEELVQVGRDDGHVAQPLQQRHVGTLGLGQHAPVELQDGPLAVEQVLAVVAALSFWPARRRDLWVTLGLLAFGAFIEVVQAQIPGRAGEWPDLLADATGIAAGLLLLGGLRWFGRRPPGTRSRS